MNRVFKINFKGDKWLFIIPVFLSIFGLVMIFDASCIAAVRDFNDKYHYLKNQIVWFFIGWLSFIFFSRFDYKRLKKFAPYFFLVNIILLVLVLIPGLGKQVLGGRRWLVLGPVNIQPAELIKLTMVIYLSIIFEKGGKFWFFLLVIFALVGLLIMEPDLGTAAIIVLTAVSLYFISGVPIKNLIFLALLGITATPLMIFGSDYRRKRFMTFLNITNDIHKDSYHVRQIILALGSGGIFGRGFGESRQKYLFLPEVTTDSIFAIIAEEFGLFGCGMLILVFLLLIYRGINTAVNCGNMFGRLLSSGIILFIGFQAIVNLSAMVLLIPLTGVPLPFVSYGGSSLVVFLTGMGILYNISKENFRRVENRG